jgi:hypothetical protein
VVDHHRRQLLAARFSNFSKQLHRQSRITAEIEKIVVGAD